jgi:hypothetical protein
MEWQQLRSDDFRVEGMPAGDLRMKQQITGYKKSVVSVFEIDLSEWGHGLVHMQAGTKSPEVYSLLSNLSTAVYRDNGRHFQTLEWPSFDSSKQG